MNNNNILEIQNISKNFAIRNNFFEKKNKYLKAVNDVSFNVPKNISLGIVGESGCGKTTLAKVILNLYEATSGKLIYKGKDITHLSPIEQKKLRTKIQIVFQDPFSSLNPRMNVGDIIAEPLLVHTKMSKDKRKEEVLKTMDLVGLNRKYIKRYPHEFSGGQRQRIMIAKALILKPEILVCDEPVSALDVSIQSQILNLLNNLKKELNLTILFISHNLIVVDYICDQIIVMYLGKIMEIATREELYSNPSHPYTQALLSAIPIPDISKKRERIILEGEVPSPINPPIGCVFSNRCRFATEKCKNNPKLIEISPNHFVACNRWES